MTERSLSDVPAASSAAVRKRMSSQAKRDTACELSIRSMLFARGHRYRVHLPVPGNARRSIDVAFIGRRVAVFVDGCWGHGCPEHGHEARSNTEWWKRKIRRNQERDAETDYLLEQQGWRVLRIWEHAAPEEAVRLVEEALAASSRPAERL